MFFKKNNKEKIIEEILFRLETYIDNNETLQNNNYPKNYIIVITKDFQNLLIELVKEINNYQPISTEINLNNFNNYINKKLEKINKNNFTKEDLENLKELIDILVKAFNKAKRKKSIINIFKKSIGISIAGILISLAPNFFTPQKENIIKNQTENPKKSEKKINELNQKDIISKNKNIIIQKKTEIKTDNKTNLNTNNLENIYFIIYKFNTNKKLNEIYSLCEKNKREIYKEIIKLFKKNQNRELISKYLLILKTISYNPKTFSKIFTSQELKDFSYIYNKIVLPYKISYVKLRIHQFIQKNHKKLYFDLRKHARVSKIPGEPSYNGNTIYLSNINPNLSYNITTYCLKYKLNLKLINTIFLIENNYGNMYKSNSGAKGLSQVKDIIREKYFPHDKSNWAYFVSTFKYLNDEGKNVLHLKIDSVYNEIPIEDFIFATLLYHEGLTRTLNHIDEILNGNPKYQEGLEYIIKAYSAYYYFKFVVNKSITRTSSNILPKEKIAI